LNKALSTVAGGIRVKFDKDPTAPTNGGSLWGGLTNYRVGATVTEIPADTAVQITIPLGYDTRTTTAPTSPFAGIVGNAEIMELSEVWVWIYPQANNVTFTVTDIVFNSASEPTPPDPLPDGVLFKLSEYIVGRGADDLAPILKNAGGDGATISAAGVTQSGITADWNGFDVDLTKIHDLFDVAAYKIKVEVTGKVLAGADGTSQMRIQAAGGPYDNPDSDYDNYSANDLNDGDVFTMKVKEIPADYVTNGNGKALRISPNGSGCTIPTSFIVTEIIITNEGHR